MLRIDPKTLRQAQEIMLEMLVAFDKICTQHNLQYWLDSGTLLGAIRHGGFIPWDDDIDISMPLEDYERFLEIAPERLPKSIFLQTRERDSQFPFDYAKLRSQKATIIEFHEKDREIGYHQGVFIDIFPMLTLPNSSFYEKFYDGMFTLLRSLSAVSLHTPNGQDQPDIRRDLQESLRRLHQGWDTPNTKVIYGGEMPDEAVWFDIDKVFPLKKISFEGVMFFVPNDPDYYLSRLYSFDYRELPPKERRLTHAEAIFINK
jgi:lipopolysaccharide cholinephosphotransferase